MKTYYRRRDGKPVFAAEACPKPMVLRTMRAEPGDMFVDTGDTMDIFDEKTFAAEYSDTPIGRGEIIDG